MKITILNEHGCETVLDGPTWKNGERFVRKFLNAIVEVHSVKMGKVSGVNLALVTVESDLFERHNYLMTFGSDVRSYLTGKGIL